MRKCRIKTIGSTGLFHKMWRGHNREAIFADVADREAYLGYLQSSFTDVVRDDVKWFSFCMMDNHTHEVGGLVPDVEGDIGPSQATFSDWMRSAHSAFGVYYNRRHDRQGKVAYDRPKTTPIQDDEAVLTVMFYGDANPVAAGLVKHPSHYRGYSSHRFYAYGERSSFTDSLTPPPAYNALGETPKERQRKYRQMCDEYLRHKGLLNDRPSEPMVDEANESAFVTNRSSSQSDTDCDIEGNESCDSTSARGDPLIGVPIK